MTTTRLKASGGGTKGGSVVYKVKLYKHYNVYNVYTVLNCHTVALHQSVLPFLVPV